MSHFNPQRRKLLIGTLAAGCVIGVSALTGCREEQAAESSDPASPDGGGDSGKVDQAAAEYQSTPKGDQQCSLCEHFIAESNTCAVVKGEVRPEGWCKLWVEAG